jgi:hypothetical protein
MSAAGAQSIVNGWWVDSFVREVHQLERDPP